MPPINKYGNPVDPLKEFEEESKTVEKTGYAVLKQRLESMKQQKREPVWKGPESDHPNGGVSFSLLAKFIGCRERFRCYAIEGLRTRDDFNHRIEYGNYWHLCEESVASETRHFREYVGTADMDNQLSQYAQKLWTKYPTRKEDILHWMNVCLVQFPLYMDYWSKHPDMVKREPLMQEEVFNVPIALRSGRVVNLKGKFDSVDLVEDDRGHSIWLQENKTKGDIDPLKLQRQLKYDMQTMMYMVALNGYDFGDEIPIRGVRYNVVRRPLSGGKGSIVRHKGSKNKPQETLEHFYGRLRDIIKEDPDNFFMRWNVEITQSDIEKFKNQTLFPLLEQLCDWWEVVSTLHKNGFSAFDFGRQGIVGTPQGGRVVYHGVHWRHPFGLYNVLDEGGSTDLDEYLDSGSEVGLQRVSTVFPELEG